jgi:hypothetical protein
MGDHMKCGIYALQFRRARQALYGSAWLVLISSGITAAQPLSGPAMESLVTSELQQVTNRPGELEVAVSPDGTRRIIATNAPKVGGFGATVVAFWNDAARTFQASNVPTQMNNRRDPTVAWAGSGDFYFATMETTQNVAVSRSTDGGQNFVPQSLSTDVRANPATRAGVCSAPCTTTDQPHIAADPRPHPAGSDEIYLVWRSSSPAGETAMIECSVDSGANWQNRQPIGGQFPRVTVGPDGSVYAVSLTSRFGGQVRLQKFNACSSGLNAVFTQGGTSAPSTVASFTGVSCPVPGLDRCNSGNALSSPTVAVDRADRNRVYVVLANQTGALNEDILVAASTDGGLTFPPAQQTTAHATGTPVRRFLPWSCASRNQLFITWYDRRTATAAQNDATEFLVNRLTLRNGRLFRLREESVSGTSDPQCASGWPIPARNIGDSENCSVQPQNAGQCLAPTATVCSQAAPCPAGQSCLGDLCFVNNTAPPRCDFSGGCAAGLSCTVGGGIAKYGDYNGIACSDSGAFLAWASATAPARLPPVAGLNIFFARVSTLSFVSTVCDRDPAICNFQPLIDKDKITIRCDLPDCRVIVPVPEICTKALNCPGCGPGPLCAPEYSLELDGLLDAWRVELLKEDGRNASAAILRNGRQTVVRFQPPKDDLLDGRAAKYFLMFRLGRSGKAGSEYVVKLKMNTRIR